MKKYSLSIFSLCFACCVSAQLGIKKNPFPAEPIMGDYLYMGVTEVSNKEYSEFLQWLKNENRLNDYKENYPDTTVWRAKFAYNEPFVSYYFQHPAYADYPVVGITQKQANNYCHWLRARLLGTKGLYNIEDIIVRLPTKKEWEFAARGGLPETAIFPWPGDENRRTGNKRRDRGKIVHNSLRDNTFIDGGTGGQLNNAGFITTPVFSYWPNGYGLYNISGNVAEWLNTPGISKGGGWYQTAYYCRIDVDTKYEGDTVANSFTGFRYIIEVVRTKSKNIALENVGARMIEKQFLTVNSLLFASSTEISNAWYQTFLQQSKQIQFSPKDSLWLKVNPYHYHLMYSNHQLYADYPVVNITYDAALAYCAWLTGLYNNSTERKYKKVIFRLPTAIEWGTMAQGGKAGNTFPWEGPYVLNSKGNYLANFHPIPQAYVMDDTSAGSNGYRKILPYDTASKRAVDGYEFTAPVKSYFPNAMGFYNCSGNVAEMLDVKGKSFGGSWDSEEYFIEISHDGIAPFGEHYSSPLPTLGFRPVMQILEK